MEVTDVRLNLVNKEGSSVKAIGSFSLDGEFAIRGVRIMEDKNGKSFVAFPSREKSNGEYEDLAFRHWSQTNGPATGFPYWLWPCCHRSCGRHCQC